MLFLFSQQKFDEHFFMYGLFCSTLEDIIDMINDIFEGMNFIPQFQV